MPPSGTIRIRDASLQNPPFPALDAQDGAHRCRPVQGRSGEAAGLIDADLGGSVVKKRVGLAGRGKRGGVRTLVATNKGNRWFFMFGFEKNERTNISDEELEGLQTIAADLLARTGPQLDEAVADGALQEICQ